MAASSIIKPELWNLDPALTDLEWDWFWQKYVITFPCFERHYSSGDAIFAPRVDGQEEVTSIWRPIISAVPVVVDTGVGVATVFSDPASGDKFLGPSDFENQFTPNGITVVAAWDHDGVTVSNGQFWGSRSTGQGTALAFFAGGITGVIEVSSGLNRVVTSPPTGLTAGLQVCAFRWNGVTGDIDVRHTGNRFNPATNNRVGTILDQQFQSGVGGGGLSTLGANRPLLCLHVFGEYISDSNVLQLFDNPFGPYYRRQDPVFRFGQLIGKEHFGAINVTPNAEPAIVANAENVLITSN